MGAGVRVRRVAALVVLVAAVWLVSPADRVPTALPRFGTAAPERPAGRPGLAPDVDRPSPRPPPRTAGPRPAGTVEEAFGAFVGNEDLAPVARYEAALGLPEGETLGYVLRYAFGTDEGGWRRWRESIEEVLTLFSAPEQPRRLVLSLPMLVSDPVPDGDPSLAAAGLATDPQDLAAGATGAYDDQWRWLGRQLVRHYGRRLAQDVLLRPGWEANGDWFPWSYGMSGGYDVDRAGDFARYWRRLHDTVMDPVRAAGTSVGWVLNAAGGGYRTGGFEAAWPGDAYVDVVSMDLYQSYDFRSPTDFGPASLALGWLEAVGAARHKLVAVDETSVSWRRRGGRQVGGGDNDRWFSSLRRWADRMVAERRLHHLLAFDADVGPNDLFAAVFPRHPQVYAFPRARADLIASFGGPRRGRRPSSAASAAPRRRRRG